MSSNLISRLQARHDIMQKALGAASASSIEDKKYDRFEDFLIVYIENLVLYVVRSNPNKSVVLRFLVVHVYLVENY